MAGVRGAAGEEVCCLRTCPVDGRNRGIPPGQAKVEVHSFQPKKRKSSYLVLWEADGSARFHRPCWDSLVEATKDSKVFDESLGDLERSMVLEAKKTAEFHDSDAVVSAEATRIASILKNSKHCIAFTGAGISTAAGCGDFRGKDGKWTNRDREKNFGSSKSKNAGASRATTMEQLRPTYTHEALCKLVDIDVISFIITQNIDGLHGLSGIPTENLAELHGNVFRESCENCGALYELKHHYRHGKSVQSAAVMERCRRCKISHRTGRKCKKEDCQGYLKNTIINFGDYLEAGVLSTAEQHARLADAVLVLGSSLKVSPANHLVTAGPAPHCLLICNRQPTSYDEDCYQPGEHGPMGSRVFCDCDKLMKKVMEKLLSQSDLQQWERERDTRMVGYNMCRVCV